MNNTISYGIIGNGLVANHFSFYLQNMGHPIYKWSRKMQMCPNNTLKNADIILVLIKDSAIEPFISNLSLNKTFIHFSGSLATPLAFGFHPLMSFPPTIYPSHFYTQIPFVVDNDAPAFQDIFPTLQNPYFLINKELKPLYHALCVLAGNGSTLLWQKLFTTFESELALPREVGFLYLQQVAKNLQVDSERALTGPLVRGDTATIEKNLTALRENPLEDIYKALIKVAR